MVALLKKVLGVAPRSEDDGGLSPSALARLLAVPSTSGYQAVAYEHAERAAGHRVLMVCTEQGLMTMANGQVFSTGNHPVEMFVPLLHFERAGFEVAVLTPTGAPARIETWAMPEKDSVVREIAERYRSQLEAPLSLRKFVDEDQFDAGRDVAIFVPGGHGAMLGLPECPELGALFRRVVETGRFVLSICHGPAAFLSTAAERQGSDKSFLFNGFEAAAFPDKMDRVSPHLGYLPGPMPWYFGERLAAHGLKLVNGKADATCHRDRWLVTGASPQAADPFGRLATQTLLDALAN